MQLSVRLLVILGTVLPICYGTYVPISQATVDGLSIKYADKEFLVKQKFFFEILRHLHQPIAFEEYLPFTGRWVTDPNKYANYTEVNEFLQTYQQGLLRKGQIFTIYNYWYAKQTLQLYRFLDNAIDWDTYYKNVIWARHNINEGMFLSALTLSVLHRKDLQGIILPAIYEIYPHYFFDGDVFHDAANRRAMDPMYGFHTNKRHNLALSNYTATFATQFYGEGSLSYFTEDVGLNSYYYYFMMDYAPFLGGDKLGLKNDRRGELYLFMHQQLLARYYLERSSNGLGPIQELTWESPIATGYYSMLRYWNGVPFRSRESNFLWRPYDPIKLGGLKAHEERVRQAIDLGYVVTRDGQQISLRQPEAIDIVGNLVSGTVDSVNVDYYKMIETTARMILAQGDYYGSASEVWPGVLMHYETSMRDPVFYQFYQRLLSFYWDFKSYLPPYTVDQLKFEGVEIKGASVEKLITYFEPFDVDISNGLGFNYGAEQSTWNFSVYARKQRLNHKPFSYVLNISSQFAGKGVVRMYMGPKMFQLSQLQYMKKLFVEMDQYMVDLVVGDNQIKRNTREFYYDIRDRTTYAELYQRIMRAYKGEEQFVLDMSEVHCGWPDRLLLPKGHPNGFPLSFFFIVTPFYPPKVAQFSSFDSTYTCGTGSGSKYIDALPFGFPFDREINFSNFATKNMLFSDVLVYHVDGNQTNESH
ncbi:hexamerin-1.1-like [Anopheles funestus]|uniref:hexamerin-1.1-like n=1 Tax=Anopheles funestus TaxID=62324 RepID=UPI0020C7267A|nr:hexamerin-1.1-like [Anopheles funestus]